MSGPAVERNLEIVLESPHAFDQRVNPFTPYSGTNGSSVQQASTSYRSHAEARAAAEVVHA